MDFIGTCEMVVECGVSPWEFLRNAYRGDLEFGGIWAYRCVMAREGGHCVSLLGAPCRSVENFPSDRFWGKDFPGNFALVSVRFFRFLKNGRRIILFPQ